VHPTAETPRVLAFPPEPADVEEAAPAAITWPLIVSVSVSVLFGAAYLAGIWPQGIASRVLAAVLVSCGAALAFTQPRGLVLLLAAYLPFSVTYPLAIGGGINGSNILMALCLVGCLVSRSRRPAGAGMGWMEWVVLAYVAFGLLAALRSLPLRREEALFDVIIDLRRWLAPYIFFFLARMLLEDRSDVMDLMLALSASVAVVAAVTWHDGIQAAAEARTINDMRVRGPMGQSNRMGAFLVYYGSPLLAFFLTSRGFKRRALFLLGYLAAARAMMFTFSRAAYLALAASAGVSLALSSPLYLVGATGLGTGAYFAGLMPQSVMDRLSHTTQEDSEIYGEDLEAGLDLSSRERLIIWRGAVTMAEARPLGVGLRCFCRSIRDYTEVPLREGGPCDAHNAFLLVAGEMGVPALVVMVVMLLSLGGTALLAYFRATHAVDRPLALGFLASLTAVIVSCLFGSRFAEEGLIGGFWLLAAAVVRVKDWQNAA
jgi:hypothetical protein